MYRVRDFAEERSRTLYVRMPKRIRDPKVVQELFNGDAKVKLPRQASRACHVIFPSLEEKIKGMKGIKDKTVDGKRIIALNPRTKPMENRIKPKKIIVPQPKPPQKITQTLFVSNINKKTNIDDLKKAFSGCISVALLDVNCKGYRSAFVKMESVGAAGEYIRNEKELPIIHGNTLSVSIDKRSRKTRRGLRPQKLKVYDEDGNATKSKFENLSPKKSPKKNIEKNVKSETKSE